MSDRLLKRVFGLGVGVGVVSLALFVLSVRYGVVWSGRADGSGHQAFVWLVDGRVVGGRGAVSPSPYTTGLRGAPRDVVHVEWGLTRVRVAGALNAVAVPVWPFAAVGLACAGAAALTLRRRAREQRRRARLGLCMACGYDVGGAIAKCPECGHASGHAPAGGE